MTPLAGELNGKRGWFDKTAVLYVEEPGKQSAPKTASVPSMATAAHIASALHNSAIAAAAHSQDQQGGAKGSTSPQTQAAQAQLGAAAMAPATAGADSAAWTCSTRADSPSFVEG